MPELKPCPACGSDNVECLVCTINADEKQDVHFHIACEACYTSGPIGDNGKIAADRWNSLPRRPDYNDVDCAGCPERRHNALTWTTEPPKVAGWYFQRAMGKEKTQRIAFVSATLSGLHCKCGCSSRPLAHWVEFEWAGPIPEPLEPEES